jgi:plasmid stabilization system protein ParE
MAVEIFPAVRNRLLEIWRYTAAQWGEAQADKYTRDLISAIEGTALAAESLEKASPA